MIRSINLFLAFLVVALTACNTGTEYGYGYNDWYDYDLDEDEVILRDEFDQVWEESDNFENWDTDADGSLDKDEWIRSHKDYYVDWDSEVYGYYEEWDLDKDNRLVPKEVAVNTFDVWDSNNDGEVSREEFMEWHPEKNPEE